MNSLDPVYPYGAAAARGSIKNCPQDFVVFEELGFEPSGDGEHLFLQIEKTGLGTFELLQRIARDYAIAPAAIGFSGLKDKHALSTQWFSLHLPGGARKPEAGGEGYRVLRAARHQRKLRRGSHHANRFRIVIRDLDRFPDGSLRQLDEIAASGMANYFGEQRFGRAGDNVGQALQQLRSKRLKRQRRGMLLSALRSHLFNQVLACRIADGIWREPLDGDVFMLRGSHSIFTAAVDASLRQRYHELDISSCASLYGSGDSRLGGRPRDIEDKVFAAHEEITACLDRFEARLQMRALRVAVEDLEFDYDAAKKILSLEVCLPAGSYLTTMLEHFVRVEDASQRGF